jgi:hypothetical protein
MEKTIFKPGEVILLDGLYGCTHEACPHTHWGVSGRQFPTRIPCGHEAEFRLIRRRLDTFL